MVCFAVFHQKPLFMDSLSSYRELAQLNCLYAISYPTNSIITKGYIIIKYNLYFMQAVQTKPIHSFGVNRNIIDPITQYCYFIKIFYPHIKSYSLYAGLFA
jgi:hypothetical protein